MQRRRWLTWVPALALVVLPACERGGEQGRGAGEGATAEEQQANAAAGEVNMAAAEWPLPPFGAAPPKLAKLPQGVTQEMVQEGHALFTGPAQCFSCHGSEAQGTVLCPTLNDREWLHVPGGEYDGIVRIIQTGVMQPKSYPTVMPPLGGMPLNNDQVRALAAYVYAISQAEPSKRSREADTTRASR